jgi:prepilin-type N-terminal cleavage/methylation domain-containing protein
MAQGESRNGFTLIELSIVLVIVGLIVGGILVGQDLIKAAETRAQISQIEKYNQAVDTFRSKFQAIPGDMAASTANQFGFYTGGGCIGGAAGYRDGNGLIDGWAGPNVVQGGGETELFWVDISSAIAGNLIEGSFPNSGGQTIVCYAGNSAVMNTTPGTSFIGNYLPTAKIGHGNFIYVYEINGFNWYGLSAVTSDGCCGGFWSSPNIPVLQAYNIDKKIDDGLPSTGAVLATYLNGNNIVANAPNAATDTTTSCYNTTSNTYSLSTSADYGAHGNCALSFRFQ